MDRLQAPAAAPPTLRAMSLTELEVEAVFMAYLVERGWSVTTTTEDFTDLIAKRGTELLIAEVKGHTKSAGAAVDIGYGQLLRRMTPERDHGEYALVESPRV